MPQFNDEPFEIFSKWVNEHLYCVSLTKSIVVFNNSSKNKNVMHLTDTY